MQNLTSHVGVKDTTHLCGLGDQGQPRAMF